MARFASEAERMRAHREEFTLALELGCTPKEAREKLRAMRARERDRAAADRLAARMEAPLTPAAPSALARDERWMMRD